MTVFPVQVLERMADGELMSRDINSRLLEDRIVFMCGELESETGNNIIAQLLYLAGVSEKPISLYINSDGGILVEALAIYDTMKYIKPIVKTICIGQACSAAAIILSAGEKGQRTALPNSRMLLHQLRGEISGTQLEMSAYSDENERLMRVVIDILVKQTGKKPAEIKIDLKKELFMSPEDALKYGIIDKIIEEGS